MFDEYGDPIEPAWEPDDLQEYNRNESLDYLNENSDIPDFKDTPEVSGMPYDNCE